MPFTKLLEGHDKFRDDYFEKEKHLFEALADGHHAPLALMITCCDARVVPALIVNADPGDLFLVRNIANLVPPFEGEQRNRSVGAAIEYAVHHLKVPHIVVCGHTQCGGLRALIDAPQMPDMPTLSGWLSDADNLKKRLEELLGTHTKEELYQQLVYENVVLQLENLLTYPVVKKALEADSLELHGWVYHLADGRLKVYNPTTNSFTKPNLLPTSTKVIRPGDENSKQTSIYFQNQTDVSILLYCVTPQGIEEFHKELAPQVSSHITTFVSNQWRIRRKSDGALLGLATAELLDKDFIVFHNEPIAL